MNPFSNFSDPEAVQAAIRRLERLSDLPSQRHTLESAYEKQRAARLATKGLPVFEDNDEDELKSKNSKPTSERNEASSADKPERPVS
jgi:hypothetical protein